MIDFEHLIWGGGYNDYIDGYPNYRLFTRNRMLNPKILLLPRFYSGAATDNLLSYSQDNGFQFIQTYSTCIIGKIQNSVWFACEELAGPPIVQFLGGDYSSL